MGLVPLDVWLGRRSDMKWQGPQSSSHRKVCRKAAEAVTCVRQKVHDEILLDSLLTGW